MFIKINDYDNFLIDIGDKNPTKKLIKELRIKHGYNKRPKIVIEEKIDENNLKDSDVIIEDIEIDV